MSMHCVSVQLTHQFCLVGGRASSGIGGRSSGEEEGERQPTTIEKKRIVENGPTNRRHAKRERKENEGVGRRQGGGFKQMERMCACPRVCVCAWVVRPAGLVAPPPPPGCPPIHKDRHLMSNTPKQKWGGRVYVLIFWGKENDRKKKKQAKQAKKQNGRNNKRYTYALCLRPLKAAAVDAAAAALFLFSMMLR